MQRTILLWVDAGDVQRAEADEIDVGHRQLRARRRSDAALIHALRIDLKHRGAKAGDPVLDRVLGAVPEGDHGDDRGDADDDAQHRQQRAQRVRAQR